MALGTVVGIPVSRSNGLRSRSMVDGGAEWMSALERTRSFRGSDSRVVVCSVECFVAPCGHEDQPQGKFSWPPYAPSTGPQQHPIPDRVNDRPLLCSIVGMAPGMVVSVATGIALVLICGGR